MTIDSRASSTLLLSAIVSLAWGPVAGRAEEPVDHAVVDAIRDEGLRRSQVMDLAGVMTDVYGPRYANSPSYDAAAAWAKQKFEEFGLQNVALEAWGEFGYGWENDFTSLHITAPQYQPVIGYPVPGTRGTNGTIRSVVVALDLTHLATLDDLAPYHGKLDGKIVLATPQRQLEPNFSPQAVRLSDEELEGMARLEIERLAATESGAESVYDDESDEKEGPSRQEIEQALEREGVALLVEPGGPNVGPMDKGVVHVSGEGPLPLNDRTRTPTVVIAAEHYNRMMRVLERGIEVEMQAEVRNSFYDDDPIDYNVIAELAGSDLAHEVVMIGGHFDAEPAGTGATDNASGSAIVMEAMRILAATDVRPRRTIRAALWGAEETGLLGSRGYVRQHFGDPESGERLAEFESLSVYFNVDWYGRFRGMYLQGNDRTRADLRGLDEAFSRHRHVVDRSRQHRLERTIWPSSRSACRGSSSSRTISSSST